MRFALVWKRRLGRQTLRSRGISGAGDGALLHSPKEVAERDVRGFKKHTASVELPQNPPIPIQVLRLQGDSRHRAAHPRSMKGPLSEPLCASQPFDGHPKEFRQKECVPMVCGRNVAHDG